jgi:hypothetical protein
MGIWIVIILYTSYVGINGIFADFIKRIISHPEYSLPISDTTYSPYSTMILFIGFPLLIFYKRLRKKRMYEYYEYMERQNRVWGYGLTDGEILNIQRKLKLDELTHKIKKQKS